MAVRSVHPLNHDPIAIEVEVMTVFNDLLFTLLRGAMKPGVGLLSTLTQPRIHPSIPTLHNGQAQT